MDQKQRSRLLKLTKSLHEMCTHENDVRVIGLQLDDVALHLSSFVGREPDGEEELSDADL